MVSFEKYKIILIFSVKNVVVGECKKKELFSIWPILTCTKYKKKTNDCAKREKTIICFVPECKKINNSDVKTIPHSWILNGRPLSDPDYLAVYIYNTSEMKYSVPVMHEGLTIWD